MKLTRLWLLAALVLVFIASSAMAHDGSFTWDFDSMNSITENHEDDDPWKGMAFVYVTNSSGIPWGDFHFTIVNGPGVIISDVIAPTMSKPIYQWSISPDGTTLDYYFYSNPVVPTEGVTFTFYTDNTANKNALFGVCGYPTVVPEPSSILLLSSGFLGTLGFALRRRR